MATETELREALVAARKTPAVRGNVPLLEQLEAVLDALKTAGQRSIDDDILIRHAPVASGQIPPEDTDQAVIRRAPVPSGQIPPEVTE